MTLRDGCVETVRVDMGEPILSPHEVPTTLRAAGAAPVVEVPLAVAGRMFAVTCLSMGNPHCVTFVDELTDDWVLRVGPLLERDPSFPNRVNAEFVQVINRGEVRQRTWERGTGETLACGSGACAVCVAGVLTGRTDRELVVHLPGGDLFLEWNASNNHVYMTGPAEEVFSGEWPEVTPQ
jgi:diaminopimelate epimerase